MADQVVGPGLTWALLGPPRAAYTNHHRPTNADTPSSKVTMAAMLLLLGAASSSAAANRIRHAGATSSPPIGVVVNACDSTKPSQRWDVIDGRISLRAPQPAATSGFCLSVSHSQVQAEHCSAADPNSTSSSSIHWFVNRSSHEIVSVGGASAGQRLDVQAYGYNGPGSVVDLYKATGVVNQQWRIDSTSGQIISMQTAWKNCSLCLDATAVPLLHNPCADTTSAFSQQPWCNSSLSLEVRVQDAVSRLSAQDKLQLFASNNPAIPALGLPPYIWGNEASTGVASGRNTQTTKFAFPITTGAAFNRTLWQLTGAAIGTEARAMANAGNGYSDFWAPVINIAREPRWGRNIETPGEDPYVVGEYAAAFTKGMQENPADRGHLMTSACCKHFAANSMEGTTQHGVSWSRHNFSADVPAQDLADSYLPPFQACVETGRVSGLMCSYNSINNVPSCANSWLMKTLARDEWSFDGYITSDCGASNDVFFAHNFTKTPEESAAALLKAGQDVDCSEFTKTYTPKALAQNLITQDDIDSRIRNLFRVRMRLGHFDPPGPMHTLGAGDICSEYTVELARDGATQGAVLIKNAASRLPLSATKSGKVAVIGPNANLSSLDSGYYGPADPCQVQQWPNLVTAVANHAQSTVTTLAIPGPNSNLTRGIPAAVEMAAMADTVILALGTDTYTAGEGHDATSISLTPAQTELLTKVSSVSKSPVIVVMMTATPLDISQMMRDVKVGAVLSIGQPSVNMLGIGDLLFGLRSPAGRMIQTIYPAVYQSEISIFDFHMRPGQSEFPRPDCPLQPQSRCPRGTNPGRTHRFYNGRGNRSAVVPFGAGLSYTTWNYSTARQGGDDSAAVSMRPVHQMLATSAGRASPSIKLVEAMGPLVRWTVNVSNTGKMDADDVVLGFLRPPGAGENGIPLQTLFGFERVHVKAGHTVSVSLFPSLLDFTQADRYGNRYALPGEYKFRFGVGADGWSHTAGMGYAEQHLVVV